MLFQSRSTFRALSSGRWKATLLTFECGRNGLGGAEGVRVRKWTLPGVADGLYSEVVTAGLGQPLDLVGVAGAAVDCHKPGHRAGRWRQIKGEGENMSNPMLQLNYLKINK